MFQAEQCVQRPRGEWAQRTEGAVWSAGPEEAYDTAGGWRDQKNPLTLTKGLLCGQHVHIHS